MQHRLSPVVVSSLLLVSGSAFATFSTVAAPAGVTQVGSELSFLLQKPSNLFAAADKLYFPVQTAANVGGRSVTVPALLRVGGTAGATAARLAFTNPYAFAAITAGSLAYTYWNDDKVWLDNPVGGVPVWKKKVSGEVCTIGCYEYGYVGLSVFKTTFEAACRAYATDPTQYNTSVVNRSFVSANGVTQSCLIQLYNKDGSLFSPSPGQYGVYITKRSIPPYDTSSIAPATEGDLVTRSGTKPITPVVLSEWPSSVPFKVPVDTPIINPSSSTPPVGQPTRVTLGSPQLVPLSNPPSYKTPVVDIVPSPTGPEPWRVDIQPKDITSTDPSAPPDVATPPATPASGTTATPKEGDPPGLCDLYPDILACAKPKLGTLEPSTITNVDKPLSILKDEGWGPSNGSCPAPKTVTVMNVHLSMPYTMLCDFATAIKPLLIAFAWLSAALTFFGMAKRD